MSNPDPYRARARPFARAPRDGRAPRLLALVHAYPPRHNAGAEWMLHAMLRHLLNAGWDVRVAVAADPGADEWQGVVLHHYVRDVELGPDVQWADVVLTHLDATRTAVAWCRKAARPLVHLVHNHAQLDYHRVRPRDSALVLWNSKWIAHRWRAWTGESMVVIPPVFTADYAVPAGDHVREANLLVNLTEAKGGPLFAQLAEERPDEVFLGVQGSYGTQEYPTPLPANYRLMANGPDARLYLARTRVALAPSSYESWGRAAVEALASGIPVVAHPTPGLLESLGPAGIFADRDDRRAWHDALDALRNPAHYARRSAMASERSHELDALALRDLRRMTDRLAHLAD